jgi:hypothetical protein
VIGLFANILKNQTFFGPLADQSKNGIQNYQQPSQPAETEIGL